MTRLAATVGPGQANKHSDVLTVQALLNSQIARLKPFLPLVEDGRFDPSMEDLIREFQRRVVKVREPDGIIRPIGPTWVALNAHPPSGGQKKPGSGNLREEDFLAAARKLDCEVAAIKAVAETEAKRKAFVAPHKPTLLFEHRKFQKFTGGRFDLTNPDISNSEKGGYGTASQHQRFEEAAKLDERAAKLSASWGMFQIMGFNFKAAGYRSVDDFVAAMSDSPREQLRAFVSFVLHDKVLANALRQKDWQNFAARYNGPDYQSNSYDVIIQAAYERLAQGGGLPPPPPKPPQRVRP
jgi:hypothetical protein